MLSRKTILAYHGEGRPGKVAIQVTKSCVNQDDLSIAYTPGVAQVCEEIAAKPETSYKYTARSNLVAVITNGTAVLGLGNLGPDAAKPVMEGKAVLFKKFADVDVFDIEVNETDPQRFIEIVRALEPTFGGINLEDIKAPECFEIEETLMQQMKIPVFHDDQHGTAIITAAALLNALKIQKKNIDDIRIVVSGAGAAAIATCNLFLEMGAHRHNIILTDSRGVVHIDRTDLTATKRMYAIETDKRTLEDALHGADVFLGVSTKNLVTADMLKSMAPNPIVFALANPDPEIPYELARTTRTDVIVATGRSDHANQVNNVLGFPFIFRGALDVQATTINVGMKVAAARALAELARKPVPEEVKAAYSGQEITFGPEYIIPKPFDKRVLYEVAPAVAQAAMDSGVAQTPIVDMDAYRDELRGRLEAQQD